MTSAPAEPYNGLLTLTTEFIPPLELYFLHGTLIYRRNYFAESLDASECDFGSAPRRRGGAWAVFAPRTKLAGDANCSHKAPAFFREAKN